MMGLAGGIMIAASFFSLLMPAIENCESTGRSPAPILTIGFLAGGAFIVVSDIVMNRMNTFKNARSKSGFLLTAAVTLHNIPEGLAVGVAFGSVVAGTQSSLIAAVMLASASEFKISPKGVHFAAAEKQGMSIGKAFFIGQNVGRGRDRGGHYRRICGSRRFRAAALGACFFRGGNDRRRLFRTDSRKFCRIEIFGFHRRDARFCAHDVFGRVFGLRV